jgi:hypothetical protein
MEKSDHGLKAVYRQTFAVLFIFFATKALAADSTFNHPLGDYSVSYPSSWKQGIGVFQMLTLTAPDHMSQITIARYHTAAGEPQTPEAFVANLLREAENLKRLDARDTVVVSDRKADRLFLSEIVELKDTRGLPIRREMDEVVVVPFRNPAFYVLTLRAFGSDVFQRTQVEFEHVERTFHLAR